MSLLVSFIVWELYNVSVSINVSVSFFAILGM